MIVTNNHVISSRPSAESKPVRPLQGQCSSSPEDDSEQEVAVRAHPVGIRHRGARHHHPARQGRPARQRDAADRPVAVGAWTTRQRRCGHWPLLRDRLSRREGAVLLLADNILLDHDCPDGCEVAGRWRGDAAICCTAPRGQCTFTTRRQPVGGSPAARCFDGDCFALLAVHSFRALRTCRRLNQPTGHKRPTKAFGSTPFRQAIAETAGGAGAEALGAGPVRWRGFADDSRAALRCHHHALPRPAEMAPEIPGASGDSMPGVSPVARQVLYAAGPRHGR